MLVNSNERPGTSLVNQIKQWRARRNPSVTPLPVSAHNKNEIKALRENINKKLKDIKTKENLQSVIQNYRNLYAKTKNKRNLNTMVSYMNQLRTANEPNRESGPEPLPYVNQRVNYRKADQLSNDLSTVLSMNPRNLKYEIFEDLDKKYDPPSVVVYEKMRQKFKYDQSGYLSHAVAQIVSATPPSMRELVISRTDQILRDKKLSR
jgi:hypothetical protein